MPFSFFILVNVIVSPGFKGILRWSAIFSYLLELTYVMIESWEKNPNSSVLTPKSASESLNLANPHTSWHWKMAILGTQNLLSGRELGIENRLLEET